MVQSLVDAEYRPEGSSIASPIAYNPRPRSGEPPGSRLPALVLAAILYATTAAAAPVFSPTPSTGWFAYSRVFIPPPSGHGPVRPDPAHRLVSNDDVRGSGKHPRFPMGDPDSP